MKSQSRPGILNFIVIFSFLSAFVVSAQENSAPIPLEKIKALEETYTSSKTESSAARKRLSVKRLIRDAGELVAANATAPNRFEVLGLMSRAQKELLDADNSTENREAFLQTCKLLLAAPNDYASLRFDADLLLSQSEMVRKGAATRDRAQALMDLVGRYRGTEIETKAIKVAITMALELGDNLIIDDLTNLISERFSGDLDMLAYQREKLGSLGAWFTGTFERSDGTVMRFPMDAMGKFTILCFWSKEGDAIKQLETLAASVKERQAEDYGRTMIVSFNLDELPDAGASILKDLGVNWPALKLPGGRENPYYKIYATRDPAYVPLSVSVQATLLMAGEMPDFKRLVRLKFNAGEYVFPRYARQVVCPRYASQVVSFINGEFLVIDPEGPLDTSRPPEIKSLGSNAKSLTRTDASIPEATLNAIQDCFIMSPIRFRTPNIELKANFEKAEALCAKAIQDHPQAPDLWIVRNRRIIALMALWKFENDLTVFNRAAAEAKTLIDSKPPAGTDIIARFCLARVALRSSEVKPKQVIADFLSALGGDKAPGPALAVASILALEIGDRMLHEELRRKILDRYIDEPMMWVAISYMVNRKNRYGLYQVPLNANPSFESRYNYFLSKGEPEDCKRTITAEFKKLDGTSFQIPKDTAGKWAVIYFRSIGNQDPAGITWSLVNDTRGLNTFMKARGLGDVQAFYAFLDDDADKVGALLKPSDKGEAPITCPVMMVPNGLKNPIVQKLGIESEDEVANVLLMRPDGSIAAIRCSDAAFTGKCTNIQNIINWHDESLVNAALEKGDIEQAKRLVFQFAPNIKPAPPSTEHLRARARVYLAMKEYDKALADAEEVLSRQKGTDGDMSLRSKELGIIEKLVEEIRKFVPAKQGE
jgi:tetratricopeptide (TPR) repeat protein